MGREDQPSPQDLLVALSLAWTRTLWGRTLPDRRRRDCALPPEVPDRRRTPDAAR